MGSLGRSNHTWTLCPLQKKSITMLNAQLTAEEEGGLQKHVDEGRVLGRNRTKRRNWIGKDCQESRAQSVVLSTLISGSWGQQRGIKSYYLSFLSNGFVIKSLYCRHFEWNWPRLRAWLTLIVPGSPRSCLSKTFRKWSKMVTDFI